MKPYFVDVAAASILTDRHNPTQQGSDPGATENQGKVRNQPECERTFYCSLDGGRANDGIAPAEVEDQPDLKSEFS